MNKISRDINTFKEGAIVDIVGVALMQKVKIERISDSGVTISGRDIGNSMVISGRSPAVLHDENESTTKPNEAILKIANEIRTDCNKLDEKQRNEALQHGLSIINGKSRAKRGAFKEALKSIKAPKDKFTIAEIAEFNSIPVPYANMWAKENCVGVGKAEKALGARGKAAILYSLK